MPETKKMPDEQTGLASIVTALIRNPGAALQLAVAIGGGFTIYYTLSQSIANVASEQLHDRADIRDRAERRNKEITDMHTQIVDGQQRGAARYVELQSKLDVTTDKIGVVKDQLATQIGTVNSKVDKLGTDIEWLIRRLDGSSPNGDNNNAGPAPYKSNHR